MKKLIYLIALISIGSFSQNNPDKFRNGIDTKLIALDTLTTAQRDAITLKASKGYVIFNADTNTLNMHNGTSWGEVSGSGVTNLSTTQTPTTVTINSDTGTDAPIALGDGVDAGVSINDYTNADKALVGSALQSGDNVSLLTNDSGYITKVGTPVNNQVGVWTGDGMLEGDSNFILENDSSFRRLSIGTSSTTGGFLRLYGHTSVAANSGISLQNNAGNQTNQEWWNIFPLFSGSQAGSLNFQATTGAVVGSALQLQSSTLLPLAVSATNTNINAESTGKVLVTREWIEAQGFGTGGGDVTKVGTPLANQIGVWTGDGTIEGISGFEYDKTTATFDIGQTVGGLAKIESGGLPMFDYDVSTQDVIVTSQNFLVSNTTTVNFTQSPSFIVPTGTVGNEAVNFTQLEAKVDDTAYAGTWDGVTSIAPSKNAVYDKIEGLILGAGTGATKISHTFTGGESSYDFGTTITASSQIAYGTTTSDLVLLQEGVSYSKSGSVVTFIGFTALANDVIVYYPNVAVPDTYTAAETTVAATPTNYTPADGSVEGHLSGIDTALGSSGSAAPVIQGSWLMGAGISRYYYTKSPEFNTGSAFYQTTANNLPAFNLGGISGIGLPITDNKTITSIKGVVVGSEPFNITLNFVKKHQEFISGDFSITATDNTLTSVTYTFVAGDVGKTVRVVGAGTGGVTLTTTIASFTGANEVELTAPADTTVASANGALETNTTLYTSSAIGVKAFAPTVIDITGISFDLPEGDRLVISTQDTSSGVKSLELSLKLYE